MAKVLKRAARPGTRFPSLRYNIFAFVLADTSRKPVSLPYLALLVSPSTLQGPRPNYIHHNTFASKLADTSKKPVSLSCLALLVSPFVL